MSAEEGLSILAFFTALMAIALGFSLIAGAIIGFAMFLEGLEWAWRKLSGKPDVPMFALTVVTCVIVMISLWRS